MSTVEERLAILEARVDRMQGMSALASGTNADAEAHPIDQIFGTFRDDPLYESAMRRGREWRENQTLLEEQAACTVYGEPL